MITTREQLETWLAEPEGTKLEFKTASQTYSFDKAVEYCVALANEGGGKIIFGVTDQRPRHIVGSNAFSDPGRIEGQLHDRLHHRIPVEELRLPEGRVLIFHVPSRIPGMAWTTPDGKVLKRAGDQLIGMSFLEMAEIYNETGPDFSAQDVEDATIEDLSEEAVSEFRTRWATKANDTRKLGWSPKETLINAELMVEGRLNYAALVLFGTRSAMGRFLPQAELVFEYRPTEASGPAADREEYRQGFFLWHDLIWEKINLRNNRQSYQDGFFRYEIPTFSEIAVREAVLNAIAHRDYRHTGSIFLKQYAHRLEIISPGGLPTGITPENILDQQNPRNRRLAEAFGKCGLIERSGQGVNLMFENAIREGKPLPDYSGTSAHEVRLRLEGQISNPAFVKYLERLGEEKLRFFSTYDFLALDHIHREQPLGELLKQRVPELIRAGAIEAVGRGKNTRYLLSRSLYAALGDKGTYTRKKGLDRDTNKELLYKHINDNAAAGARIEEFEQVLPHVTRRHIQRLLAELREAGRITKVGGTRYARWFPSDD